MWVSVLFPAAVNESCPLGACRILGWVEAGLVSVASGSLQGSSLGPSHELISHAGFVFTNEVTVLAATLFSRQTSKNLATAPHQQSLMPTFSIRRLV